MDKKKDTDKWQKYELAADEILEVWDTEIIDIKLQEDIDIDDLVEILNIHHGGIIDEKNCQRLR